MNPDSFRPLPPIEYLRECFDVDVETGRLRFRARPEHHFVDRPRPAANWNSRYAGKIADSGTKGEYFTVCIDGPRYFAHRVIYKMTTGVDPLRMQVDHINRIKDDNRPVNLRLASQSQNSMNFGGPRKNNSHGGRGVHWNSHANKWQVTLTRDMKKTYLGVYESHEEAVKVATDARRSTFGEFFG